MNAEQARECFSDALEGELSAERKVEFEAALAADSDLAAEYAQFQDTFRAVARIAQDEPEVPDLLHGVQERLRKRSRGRYYRDRFATRSGRGWALPLVLGTAMLVVLILAWVFLQTTVVLEPPRRDPPAQH